MLLSFMGFDKCRMLYIHHYNIQICLIAPQILCGLPIHIHPSSLDPDSLFQNFISLESYGL